jgi:hypothetical protein
MSLAKFCVDDVLQVTSHCYFTRITDDVIYNTTCYLGFQQYILIPQNSNLLDLDFANEDDGNLSIDLIIILASFSQSLCCYSVTMAVEITIFFMKLRPHTTGVV